MTFQKFILICLSLAFCVALENLPEEKKSRVVQNELSDEDHFVGEDHNPEYDHEAFLGEEEAKIFDQLSPAQSIKRLGQIVDKIDKDEDGFVTHEELKDWIVANQDRYITENVKEQWEARNPEEKEKLPWKDYKTRVYGFLDESEYSDDSNAEGVRYLDMLKRDERRWKAADADGDDALTIEEFTFFLHPEESTHMKDIVVLETIEDVDKDKDGKISIDEYIGDMFSGEEDSHDESEPEWVNIEREQFNTVRDQDKNGYLEMGEVRDWIMPPDYEIEQASAEATHLISQSDSDSDSRLTKDEILDKYDVFVGSQVTDFGDALLRHDEF